MRRFSTQHLLITVLLLYLVLAPACHQEENRAQGVDDKQGVVVSEGVNIFYETTGEGAPVLVVHGGPGLDHSYLRQPMQALADEFQLIFYDQRCVGESEGVPTPSTITLETFVHDLEALQKGLGLEKFHLVAHSWGALVAMKYASKHSDKLLSLTLLNSLPARYQGMMHVDALVRSRHSRIVREGLEAVTSSEEFLSGDLEAVNHFLNLWFSAYIGPKTRKNAVYFDVKEQTAQNWSRVNALMVRSLGRFDLLSEISYIDTPTLIVQGEADVIPTKYIDQIHTNVPAAEHLMIPDSGHFPFLEAPNVLFPTLRRFLQAHSL